MSSLEFDPEQDVLEDVERIIDYASDRHDIAKISLGMLAAGAGCITVGLAEIMVESAEEVGNITCGFGILGIMTGALSWGFNEFRHSIRMSNIN